MWEPASTKAPKNRQLALFAVQCGEKPQTAKALKGFGGAGVLAGKIEALQRHVKRHCEELGHLDATIKLFDPSYVVGSILPRRWRRLHLFKQGELVRLVLDALRRAQGTPLSVHESAAAVVAAIGQPEGAKPIMTRRVRASLAYLECERKMVVKIGEREEARWTLRVATVEPVLPQARRLGECGPK